MSPEYYFCDYCIFKSKPQLYTTLINSLALGKTNFNQAIYQLLFLSTSSNNNQFTNTVFLQRHYFCSYFGSKSKLQLYITSINLLLLDKSGSLSIIITICKQ